MKQFICVGLVLSFCLVQSAFAGVNLDIDVGVPAPLAMTPVVIAPTPVPVPVVAVEQYRTSHKLIVVPSNGQYVYMMSGTPGMYFYQGNWYRYYQGNWYVAPLRSNTWVPVQLTAVPPVIIAVPPAYPLYVPAGYYQIPFAEFSLHWKDWESSRNWDRQQWYRAEVIAHQSRINSIAGRNNTVIAHTAHANTVHEAKKQDRRHE
jgi:hypothetical protein